MKKEGEYKKGKTKRRLIKSFTKEKEGKSKNALALLHPHARKCAKSA